MPLRVEAHGQHVVVVTIDNQARRNAMPRAPAPAQDGVRPAAAPSGGRTAENGLCVAYPPASDCMA